MIVQAYFPLAESTYHVMAQHDFPVPRLRVVDKHIFPFDLALEGQQYTMRRPSALVLILCILVNNNC